MICCDLSGFVCSTNQRLHCDYSMPMIFFKLVCKRATILCLQNL